MKGSLFTRIVCLSPERGNQAVIWPSRTKLSPSAECQHKFADTLRLRTVSRLHISIIPVTLRLITLLWFAYRWLKLGTDTLANTGRWRLRIGCGGRFFGFNPSQANCAYSFLPLQTSILVFTPQPSRTSCKCWKEKKKLPAVNLFVLRTEVEAGGDDQLWVQFKKGTKGDQALKGIVFASIVTPSGRDVC